MRNSKYVFLLTVISVLIIYQVFLSFKIIPPLVTGQDIVVLVLLLVSVFLYFLSQSIERVSRGIAKTEERVTVRKESESETPNFEMIRNLEDKGMCRYFVAIQNYLKVFYDMKELTDKLLVAAARVTHSERASILLYNKKAEELYIYRTLGWSNNEIKLITNTRIKPGEGIAGRVYLDGEPVVMNEKETKGEGELKDKYKSSSFLSFPVYSGERIIGVLNLTEKDTGAYTKQEIGIVHFIINEVALHLRYIMGTSKENL